jgi:hypothetical protein
MNTSTQYEDCGVYMGYEYYDGLLDEPLTAKRARRIVERDHGASWAECVAELGEHATYTLGTIGAWLGY